MRVDSEKPFRQLMREGVLATMRRYPYKEGQVVRIYHKGRYVGEAVVEHVMPTEFIVLSPRLVDSLVRISGFSTLGEWEEEAKKLNRSKMVPPYLVIIKLLQDRGG